MLEIENLVVDYGYIRALKGINMSVEEGSIVAILGANGAGKSTTVRTVSGIVKAKSGKVSFMEKDITNKEVHKIAARGIIQSPEGRMILNGLTTEENLLVGAYSIKSKAQVHKNLEEVFSYFPVLKERRKQQASTLSGGEQQMLAIGRALMSKPKLLLLDEPSLGLAPLIVREIFSIIKRIKDEGTTILIVEQNAYQTLKIADYAYVLELGTVKTEGTGKALMKDESLFAAYLGKRNKGSK
ncbi:MAG: ABC transporter ATP-binding protein [Clostridia bacterium]|nr:ABC transporter ATP-binding protein [Clostridia bacterium]